MLGKCMSCTSKEQCKHCRPSHWCSGRNTSVYHGKPNLLLFVAFRFVAIGWKINSQFWTIICPRPCCSQGSGGRQRYTKGWQFDQLERDPDKDGTRWGKTARVDVEPPWKVHEQPSWSLDPRISPPRTHHIRRNTCQHPQIASENVSQNLVTFTCSQFIWFRLIGKELSKRLIMGKTLYFPFLRIHIVNIEAIVGQNWDLISQVNHNHSHCHSFLRWSLSSQKWRMRFIFLEIHGGNHLRRSGDELVETQKKWRERKLKLTMTKLAK